jgi:hypothetical protein
MTELQVRILEQQRLTKEASLAALLLKGAPKLLRSAPKWMKGSFSVPYRYTAGRWMNDTGKLLQNTAMFTRGSVAPNAKMAPWLDKVYKAGGRMHDYGASQLSRADSLGRVSNLKGWNKLNPIEWGRATGRHYFGIGAGLAAGANPLTAAALWGPGIALNPLSPWNLMYAGSVLPRNSNELAQASLLKNTAQSYPRRIS